MAPLPHKKPKTWVEEQVEPLSTWQELVEWRPQGGRPRIRKLRPRTASSQPRTLVCHDMKGGYLEDRFVGGCSNKDAYRFYHWSGVDTFVYFSHHLVTIPPQGWINAAHIHGVTVLGTFITEWEAGSGVCKELLASEETVAKAVSQLVDIAHHHGFEGWLINIENEIPAEKIPLMQSFVRDLTRVMRDTNTNRKVENQEKERVKERRDAQHCVIWYDSVTEKGKLEWQNELNPLNQAFFDACDGIFLNYTWTEEHLARSREAAGGRTADVFVGLDVFGRNFYEGGKYNTWKALKVARKFGLSAAIFAPGWTYETQTDFAEAEKRLWGSLAPLLTHRGPQDFPLTTSFCQGFGEHLFCRGKVEKEGPWHNLGHQQLQPLWSMEDMMEEEAACVSLVTEEAYNGGGCLGVTTSAPATLRLVMCGLEWQGALRVSVTYKWCSQPTSLALLCSLSSSDSGQHRTLEFQCEEEEEGDKTEDKDKCEEEKEGGKTEDNDKCEEEKTVECTQVESHIENGWSVRTFTAQEMSGYKVTHVALRVGGAAELRLGHLDITNTCPSKVEAVRQTELGKAGAEW